MKRQNNSADQAFLREQAEATMQLAGAVGDEEARKLLVTAAERLKMLALQAETVVRTPSSGKDEVEYYRSQAAECRRAAERERTPQQQRRLLARVGAL